MGDVALGVGIQAALERAEAHKARVAPRKLTVRIHPGSDGATGLEGLVVRASIASRSNGELEAQDGKGVRLIPWSEADARAKELVDVVDVLVAEVEAAVAGAAPDARPSITENDMPLGAYMDLSRRPAETMLAAAQELLERAPTSLSTPATCEALSLGALEVVALLCVGGRLPLEDLQEILGEEVRALRSKAQQGERVKLKRAFDA